MFAPTEADREVEPVLLPLGSFETSVNNVRALTKARKRVSGSIRFWKNRPFCIIVSIFVLLCVSAVIFWLIREEEASAPKSWPWQNWCRQKILQTREDDTGCIVNSRMDLPAVRKDAEYDVFYAINILSGGAELAAMFNLGQSTILLREKGKDLGEGLNMVIQYSATDFGPEVIAPVIHSNGSLKWQDDTVLAWYPWANYSSWLNASKVTHVGSVSGVAVDKWFYDIPRYALSHLGYEIWSVMNGVDVGTSPSLGGAQVYSNSSICHDFAEWGLLDLYRYGASFQHDEPLCRTYFILQTKKKPTYVADDLRPDMINFYQHLRSVMYLSFNNLTEFSHFMQTHFERHGHNAYTHRKKKLTSGPIAHRYFRVELVPPFMSPNLYQRIPLPWYTSPARKGECSSQLPENEQFAV